MRDLQVCDLVRWFILLLDVDVSTCLIEFPETVLMHRHNCMPRRSLHIQRVHKSTERAH